MTGDPASGAVALLALGVFMHPVIALVVGFCLLLLYGLFRPRRINYAAGAWFTNRCPSCRSRIDARAKVCQCCHRDVPPQRWIWEQPAAPRTARSPGWSRVLPYKHEMVAVGVILVIGVALIAGIVGIAQLSSSTRHADQTVQYKTSSSR
jgi:hypothetical protein